MIRKELRKHKDELRIIDEQADMRAVAETIEQGQSEHLEALERNAQEYVASLKNKDGTRN